MTAGEQQRCRQVLARSPDSGSNLDHAPPRPRFEISGHARAQSSRRTRAWACEVRVWRRRVRVLSGPRWRTALRVSVRSRKPRLRRVLSHLLGSDHAGIRLRVVGALPRGLARWLPVLGLRLPRVDRLLLCMPMGLLRRGFRRRTRWTGARALCLGLVLLGTCRHTGASARVMPRAPLVERRATMSPMIEPSAAPTTMPKRPAAAPATAPAKTPSPIPRFSSIEESSAMARAAATAPCRNKDAAARHGRACGGTRSGARRVRRPARRTRSGRMR